MRDAEAGSPEEHVLNRDKSNSKANCIMSFTTISQSLDDPSESPMGADNAQGESARSHSQPKAFDSDSGEDRSHVAGTTDVPGEASIRSPTWASNDDVRQPFDQTMTSREAMFVRELAESERKAAGWEKAYRRALRESELASVLASKSLVPGAAGQLVKLWSDEFEVLELDGRLRVSTQDGKSVSEAVKEWLASPEYSHFCQPTSRGGTTQASQNLAAQGSHGSTTPRTLGEVAIQKWRDSLSSNGDGIPIPIGLHPQRRFR